MILALAAMWPQPLAPVHSLAVSALVAAVPLAIVLVLMGILRTSSLLASVCGLAAAGALALLVWHMPFVLIAWSTVYGCVYAAWPIMWIVFCALWLYNLTVVTGKFDLLRALDGAARFGRSVHSGDRGGVLFWSAARRHGRFRRAGCGGRVSAGRARDSMRGEQSWLR